jgi:hypothetical protein
MSEFANERGNRLRGEGKFEEAHRAYTMAIEMDETNTLTYIHISRTVV